MRLTFSDGMTFNLAGPLRVERRSDGLYVVGGGMLCAVHDEADAERVMARVRKQNDRIDAMRQPQEDAS